MTTDILGHDCNGKPLRAGDMVIGVPPVTVPWTRAHMLWTPFTVTGPALDCSPGFVQTDVPDDTPGSAYTFKVRASFTRKLSSDDEEAPEHDKVVQVEPA